MSTVAVNPPKTPVTRGSTGVAAATLPNVCKMPGPPAPFVPTPLPNIGKSGDSPKGYSKSVTIDGDAVAVAGASFGSQGDIASKGTGGGVVSNNTHGPTKFLGPGAMNVQIEGKNVQLLSDPMLNNCGPSGSPANAATMTGIIQKPGNLEVIYGDDAPCTSCGKTHPLEAGKDTLMMIRTLYRTLQRTFDMQKSKIRDMSVASKVLRATRTAIQNLKMKKNRGGLSPAEVLELTALNLKESTQALQVQSFDAFFRTNAILRWEDNTGTYSKPYMIGVMICACTGKKLAACSGEAPPAFGRVVAQANFVCASPSIGTNSGGHGPWQCAAKQIMDRAQGHKPKELIERWFAPVVKGVKASKSPKLEFDVLIEDPKTKALSIRKETLYPKSGGNAPSCDKCQNNLPALYCRNKC